MTIKLISGINCVRCRFLQPHLKARAEAHGYEFKELDVNNATPEDLGEASMLPVIWFDDEQIDYDEALSRISN